MGNRGQIAVSDYYLKKAQAINALLVRPIAILPTEPGDTIKPFAVGLFDEIRYLLRPDCALIALRRAVGAYVNSKAYFLVSAQPDSMRHDIDGHEIEPLSEEARRFAQERLFSGRNHRATTDAKASAKSEPAPTLSKAEQIRASLLKPRPASSRVVAIKLDENRLKHQLSYEQDVSEAQAVTRAAGIRRGK